MLIAGVALGADEAATQIGGIDVVVWTPSAVRSERLPVLMFSHALYMCPTQSRFLTSAVADAGYLVIAPRHSDSACHFSMWPNMWRMSAKPSPLWNDSDYRDRANDIRAVVAALPGDRRYGSMADVERLALMGHSLGGYTVLGLGGAWPSWKMAGVRAIVALTPYSLPFEHSEGLRHISAPVMYQAGALDPVFTLPIEHFGYAQTPKPKYLVEMAWANHLAWTDLGVFGRHAITDYVVAFLDHYVKDDSDAADLHVALPWGATLLHD